LAHRAAQLRTGAEFTQALHGIKYTLRLLRRHLRTGAKGDQSRHRRAMTRDGNFFAVRDRGKQLGQPVLGFKYGDGFHKKVWEIMDSHILSWTGIWCNAPQLRNRSSISLRMMCSNTGAIIAAGNANITHRYTHEGLEIGAASDSHSIGMKSGIPLQ
jgi:hypothetical protein